MLTQHSSEDTGQSSHPSVKRTGLCGGLAGAQALPIDGETWQVMRQSRNRNWGHPNLVQFLERLANQAPAFYNNL